jgi:hypothetical protein
VGALIPEAAVEAAHAVICEDSLDDCLEWRGRCVKAVEAAAPFIAAPILALVAEAESRPGSSAYCTVTTYQLREALGQDVTDWVERVNRELGA